MGAEAAGVGRDRERGAYVDALHNLARDLTGNETDAEALAQETYARLAVAACGPGDVIS